MTEEKKKTKRVGLLQNELTAPRQTFDITKSNIEPLNVGLSEIKANKKEKKEKKYIMLRLPEMLKIQIDELKQIKNDRFIYTTIEDMYDFYVAHALSDEKKNNLKILKSLRENKK